ncbi:MAG: YdcF family protein [Planctomycetes bacterium]|nr:YdcF family protein [Planctomycetota bacterium]
MPAVGRSLLRSLECYAPLPAPDPRGRAAGAAGTSIAAGAANSEGEAGAENTEHNPRSADVVPLPPADAIVVLGAESEAYAPEYGGATLGAFSLERTRYAAALARRTRVPVLCSGRAARDGERSVADLMADALGEWGIEARWIEPCSTNTRENAERSAVLLQTANVRRIMLVSHAWHLARAVPEFERLGFEVVPAPTAFAGGTPLRALDFLPSAKGLRQSQLALHEWLGRAWYALR